MNMALVVIATQEEAAVPADLSEAWADEHLLHLLREGAMPPDLSAVERARVVKRAKLYAWQQGKLHRRMGDGSLRLVPPPAERQDVILAAHEQCGHFGQKRTSHLLLTSFWWRGIHQDVTKVVQSCAVCDRVKASFNASHAHLSPLPINGLFYRWGVDLAGPFPVTATGGKYVMVCIEHLSKQVELIPLPAKGAPHTARA